MRGELEVKVKGLPDSARLLYAAVRQAIYAGAAMSASIGALILHLHHEDRLAFTASTAPAPSPPSSY